jgi:ATP-binding cassette subfamily B protein
MGDDGRQVRERSAARTAEQLPDDVREWLKGALRPEERVAACLLADIMPTGEFGERWAFLTSERLMVLLPNGRVGQADIEFQMPLAEIQGVHLRDYVGSGTIVVEGRDKGHEIARFSLGAFHEASDLCHYVEQVIKERDSGKSIEEMRPAATKRPEHRCPKCGRALSRWSQVCFHCINRSRVLSRLFSYLLPYGRTALLGLGLTLAITACSLAPPYLLKVLVDDVVKQRNVELFAIIVAVMIGVNVGSTVISMFRSYIMQWLGQRVLFDMRVQLYDHMQMLRLSYYNQRETGQIMNRVTGDLNRLQYFISEGFQDALINVVTMLLIAMILLMMDWRLFIIALAPTPIIAFGTWLFGHKVHLLYHRLWRRWASLSAILADTIPGIRVVKSFAQEKRESQRFGNQSADLFQQEMRAAKLQSAFFPFVGLMTSLGSILIFVVGGYMVLRNSITLGVLIAFNGYLFRFYQPIQQFGQLNHRLQHCVTSAERVFEILDADPEPIEHQSGLVIRPVEGRVEFRDVRFSYEPGKYALDGVSFSVEPGEMIGLVGPSGAGKSTLVHLIARFYDVEEGQVLIDGHDIQDLDLKSFREQIGVVLQEPYLFHGSVWANIAYAKPEAGADEIIAAAKAANAHNFVVNLPDGYDTIIGERGQTLSGGERQRISIARAVLRDPRILILDEATASVDTETEVMIQTALERLVQNRTTFAIAHRLSTLRKATRLIVLERGKLIEIGTHEQLLDSGGLYGRLCELQSKLSKMRAY